MLRICALILCLLAATRLNWTAAPASHSADVTRSFSLVTIQIDKSEHFIRPNEPAQALLP